MANAVDVVLQRVVIQDLDENPLGGVGALGEEVASTGLGVDPGFHGELGFGRVDRWENDAVVDAIEAVCAIDLSDDVLVDTADRRPIVVMGSGVRDSTSGFLKVMDRQEIGIPGRLHVLLVATGGIPVVHPELGVGGGAESGDVDPGEQLPGGLVEVFDLVVQLGGVIGVADEGDILTGSLGRGQVDI